MLTTRGALALLAAFIVIGGPALALDRSGDALQQAVLGLCACVFLAIALGLSASRSSTTTVICPLAAVSQAPLRPRSTRAGIPSARSREAMTWR